VLLCGHPFSHAVRVGGVLATLKGHAFCGAPALEVLRQCQAVKELLHVRDLTVAREVKWSNSVRLASRLK
jgi:hypothetical protein